MTVHLLAFEEAVGFGGAFVDLAHIALALRRRGARVTIARTHHGEHWDELAAEGVELLEHRRWDLAIKLTQAQRFNVPIRKAVYAGELMAQHLPLALRYARWGRQHGVTHVFCNNSHNHSPAAVVAARMMNVPCWSYFQGNINGHNLFEELSPLVDFGFGVSRHVAEQARRNGFSHDRLDVLYPGVELPPAAQAAPRPDDGRVRVGMVGMITRWKGQLCFLKAFARAAQEVDNLDALLFGRPVDGQEDYLKEVCDTITHLGLAGRVRLVGDRTTPGAIYPDCDFTVHCSTEPEPFGRVVIEAMSYGRPVIASDEGGPGEVISHGADGFLVHPHDVQGMATHLVELATQHERRVDMGRRARRRVEEDFSYPAVLGPLLRRLGIEDTRNRSAVA